MDKEQVRSAAEQVWRRVLGTQIEDTTDFFDVGGHSFLAMRMVALLEEALSVATPVTLLFNYPVFADFVDAAAEQTAVPAAD